jgi:hypothetical protein
MASCTIGIANMNREEEEKIKNPTICFLKKKNETKIPMMIMHSKALFV